MIGIGQIIKHELLKERLIKTSNDGIKTNSPNNVLLALKYDEYLGNYLRQNDFSYSYEAIEEFKLGNTVIKKGELPANFSSILTVFLEKQLGVVFTKSAITDGLTTFFSERSYNPVKDYMEKSFENWDGETRIYRLLQEYLGAEDTALTAKICEMWVVGAVSKVYDPYGKFDYVLDLIGSQGVGKTSFLQRLGGIWYTDDITDFVNKDNYDIMLKSLIVNDDEMVASGRMSFEETKAFISKTSIRYRKPYMPNSEEYPKNFVIARTTNQTEYLKDKTGERRFLPIEANKARQKRHPMTLTNNDVEQIWGEAVAIYKAGKKLLFDEKTELELSEYRERFIYKDEVEEQVLDYLNMLVPHNFEEWSIYKQRTYTEKYFSHDEDKDFYIGTFELTKVSVKSIMYNLFKRDATDKVLSRKITLLLNHLDNWEKTVFKLNKITTRGYRKIK